MALLLPSIVVRRIWHTIPSVKLSHIFLSYMHKSQSNPEDKWTGFKPSLPGGCATLYIQSPKHDRLAELRCSTRPSL